MEAKKNTPCFKCGEKSIEDQSISMGNYTSLNIYHCEKHRSDARDYIEAWGVERHLSAERASGS